MDRLTVHALPATSWTLVTTKRAPMWTNVQTKRYPISDVLIIASICPEAPNASARLATSFVPIRKLAKVRETEKLNFFEKEREREKKKKRFNKFVERMNNFRFLKFFIKKNKRYRRMRQGKRRMFTRVRQSQRRNEMRMSRWIPSERNRRQDLPRH
jgi:hypothetical protein